MGSKRAMPTSCSTSPTGWCWSPAAAAVSAGRWHSPRRGRCRRRDRQPQDRVVWGHRRRGRAEHGVTSLPVGCNVAMDRTRRPRGCRVRAFGRVDVLVNNAGTSPNLRELGAVHRALFDSVMNLNLKGPFRLRRRSGTHGRGRRRRDHQHQPHGSPRPSPCTPLRDREGPASIS